MCAENVGSPDAILARPTRLLVVDDELSALAVIPEALRDGLEDHGWRALVIETAASGEEALEVAAAGDALHLLVTDVIMPGIDGIETYARLKERFPHLSCVVMTAQAPTHTTPIRALRLGAADYVSKPINPDYLVQTCHRQLVVHHLRAAVDEGRVLLDSIVQSVDTGVLALRDDQILCVNAAAERLLGPLDGSPTARLRELGLDTVRPGPGETGPRAVDEVRLGAGVESPRVNVVGSPVVDRTGKRLGEVLVLEDVTHFAERKSIASFKRMAAIAAHEMKNSVTGLGLVTQHLVARLREGRVDPDETGRMAEIILDSVARLDRFARSFLDFSRIPDPHVRSESPDALMAEAISLYGERKGLPEWVEVEQRLAGDLPAVQADRDLIFQVLQNLIINAVEAMEGTSRRRLRLETAREGEWVRLTVSDEGTGIPGHMLERIFEPNVTTREAGSGLGLVIVRDIVHKHGGRVAVRSVPGEGATFDVLLPVAAE